MTTRTDPTFVMCDQSVADEARKLIGATNQAVDRESKINDIARSLLDRVLLRVSCSDCKPHRGGIVLPNRFDIDIEEAARAMKANGFGWEEYT